MSRGFVKEGDQEEIPVVTPRAFLPAEVPNYVTPEGLEALHSEMRQLQNEYAEASNYLMQNHINAKMNLLQERISSAVVIDTAKVSTDTVSFGLYVSYNDRTIRIVGVDEADFAKGLISFVSPIAKALTGHKQGDSFEMKVPKGIEKITIHQISATPLPLTIMTRKETPTASKPIENTPKKTASHPKIIDIPAEKQDFTEEKIVTTEGKANENIFQPKDDPMAFLPIVNERGNIVGHAQHCKIHEGTKLLHPAVHLLVSNSEGKVIGRYWWHVAFGETPETTLKRKAIEDLGLVITRPSSKAKYIRDTQTEKEMVFVFTAVSDNALPVTPDSERYLQIFAKD